MATFILVKFLLVVACVPHPSSLRCQVWIVRTTHHPRYTFCRCCPWMTLMTSLIHSLSIRQLPAKTCFARQKLFSHRTALFPAQIFSSHQSFILPVKTVVKFTFLLRTTFSCQDWIFVYQEWLFSPASLNLPARQECSFSVKTAFSCPPRPYFYIKLFFPAYRGCIFKPIKTTFFFRQGCLYLNQII